MFFSVIVLYSCLRLQGTAKANLDVSIVFILPYVFQIIIRESVRLTQLWCGIATRTSVVIDGLFGGAGLPIVMPRCAIKNEKSWEHEP